MDSLPPRRRYRVPEGISPRTLVMRIDEMLYGKIHAMAERYHVSVTLAAAELLELALESFHDLKSEVLKEERSRIRKSFRSR